MSSDDEITLDLDFEICMKIAVVVIVTKVTVISTTITAKSENLLLKMKMQVMNLLQSLLIYERTMYHEPEPRQPAGESRREMEACLHVTHKQITKHQGRRSEFESGGGHRGKGHLKQ